MMTGLGGAFHVVEVYNVAFLKYVLVKPCLSSVIKHGSRIVHSEHPSGPRTILLICKAQSYAIWRGYGAEIRTAASIGITVLNQSFSNGVHTSTVIIFKACIGVACIVKHTVYGTAVNIYGDCYNISQTFGLRSFTRCTGICFYAFPSSGRLGGYYAIVPCMRGKFAFIAARTIFPMVGLVALPFSIRMNMLLFERRNICLVSIYGNGARCIRITVIPFYELITVFCRSCYGCRCTGAIVAAACNSTHCIVCRCYGYRVAESWYCFCFHSPAGCTCICSYTARAAGRLSGYNAAIPSVRCSIALCSA